MPERVPEQTQEHPPRTDMLLALRFRAYDRICWDGRDTDRQAAMRLFRDADGMLAEGETDMREATADSEGLRYPGRDSMLLDIRRQAYEHVQLYRRNKDREGAMWIFRLADLLLREKPRQPQAPPREPVREIPRSVPHGHL